MKKLSLMSLSVVIVMALVGCGGSSSSSVTAAKTGTGYYVDNAVAGVDYVCGTQTGKTDKDGKFIFEEGKACKFSLAGIPLRTTNADDLVDGKEVLEDNPKVAQFLQSIDANNDLSDGIQITDEVLVALTTALETSQSIGTLPEGTVLTEVVAAVGHDVTAVTGDVRTDAQVQEHLGQTQTEITKALLAGKTFYTYFIDHDNGDTPTVTEIKFNNDVTSFTDESGNVITSSVNADVITLSYPDGGTDVMKVTVSSDNKYISLYEDENGWFKLFHVKSDAEALLPSESTLTETTKALLAGKTFYVVSKDDGSPLLEKIVVNQDVTKFQLFDENDQLFDTRQVNILGNKLTFPNDNDGAYTLISQKDGYLLTVGYNADGTLKGNDSRLYPTKTDAEAYFATLEEHITPTLSDLIVGKTKYFLNSHGGTGNRTYNTDGTYTSIFSGNTRTGTYTIQGNVLTVTTSNNSIYVLTYLNTLGTILNFDITVNGGETFQTSMYQTETARDAANSN